MISFLKVVYAADTGAAFIDGELVADNYNNGTPWVIGLKRFVPEILEHGLTLKFRPLRKGVLKNTSSAMAARLVFEGNELLQVDSIDISPEYVFRSAVITANKTSKDDIHLKSGYFLLTV